MLKKAWWSVHVGGAEVMKRTCRRCRGNEVRGDPMTTLLHKQISVFFLYCDITIYYTCAMTSLCALCSLLFLYYVLTAWIIPALWHHCGPSQLSVTPLWLFFLSHDINTSKFLFSLYCDIILFIISVLWHHSIYYLCVIKSFCLLSLCYYIILLLSLCYYIILFVICVTTSFCLLSLCYDIILFIISVLWHHSIYYLCIATKLCSLSLWWVISRFYKNYSCVVSSLCASSGR